MFNFHVPAAVPGGHCTRFRRIYSIGALLHSLRTAQYCTMQWDSGSLRKGRGEKRKQGGIQKGLSSGQSNQDVIARSKSSWDWSNDTWLENAYLWPF